MTFAHFPTYLRGLAAGLVLLLGAGPARAQLAPDSARLAVKLAAARLLVSTYEVEVEYRWAARLSVVLAPRLVAGAVPALISSAGHAAGDQVRGGGVGLSGRFYVPVAGVGDSKLTGFYVSLRAEYQRLRLRYQQEAWGEDQAADGLYYYAYRPRTFTETINQLGGACTLGYQCQVVHPRLRLDASVSLNRLESRSSAGPASRYRSSALDYGSSETFGSLGLGLGFVLK